MGIVLLLHSVGPETDRLDPSETGHRQSSWWTGARSIAVVSWVSSWGKPSLMVSSRAYATPPLLVGRRNIRWSWLIRLIQNLSFVIMPLKTVSIGCWMSHFRKIRPESGNSMLGTISLCCEKSLWHLLHHSPTTGSVRGRRKQAAWSDAFMAQLLT